MIRFGTAKDATNLSALSIHVWLETYAKDGIRTEYAEYALRTFTEQYFADLVISQQYKVVVAEDSGFIRGFAVVNLDSHFNNESNGFEIEKLYIHQPFRDAGFGREILRFVERKIGHRFWLYTWVDNASNTYYEHIGFQNIGKHTFQFHGWDIENHVYGFKGQ